MAIFYTILFFLLAIIFGIGNEGNFSLKNIIIVLVFVSVIKFIYGSFVNLIEHLDKKHNPNKKKNQKEELKEWSRRNRC